MEEAIIPADEAQKRADRDPAKRADLSSLKHKIVFLPPAKLKPYERNPTLHPIEHVAQIVASIKEFGFTIPVLVDENDMILAGHGRQLAALDLELETIPVIRRTGLSEAQKRAYVLADNKIARNADLDWQLVAGELQALQDLGFNLELTGFRDFEFEPLLEADWTPPDPHDNEIGMPDMHHIAVTPAQKDWIDRAHTKVAKEKDETQMTIGEALEIVCQRFIKLG